MISFMLDSILVVFTPSTLTEKQSLRCIATWIRTVEDELCSKRRQDTSVSFHRTWNDYRSGSGDLGKNVWLGNEKIYRITAANKI